MSHLRKLLLVTAAAMSFTATAEAANISFTGNLAGPNDVLSFAFTTTSAATVTLRSYSYAGGVNAAGTTIARGGFDPILALYNSLGLRTDFYDDGPGTVPVDAVTGLPYDVNLATPVIAGSYTVLISAYSNFCGTTLAAGCQGGGSFTDVSGHLRDSHFAFDVLNVATATQVGGGTTAVPEPMSLSLFGAGLLGLGFVRRRKVTPSA